MFGPIFIGSIERSCQDESDIMFNFEKNGNIMGR